MRAGDLVRGALDDSGAISVSRFIALCRILLALCGPLGVSQVSISRVIGVLRIFLKVVSAKLLKNCVDSAHGELALSAVSSRRVGLERRGGVAAHGGFALSGLVVWQLMASSP